jgi:hypothetical protein
MTQDLVDAPVLHLQQQGAARLQTGPENRMGQEGASFRQRSDAVTLGHGTRPQRLELREDEPHPVAGLAAAPQLVANVIDHRRLGGDESLEVEGILSHMPSLQRNIERAAQLAPLSYARWLASLHIVCTVTRWRTATALSATPLAQASTSR